MEDKMMLKKELARISFAMDDVRLFLDTHPDCCEALNMYNELRRKREETVARYEACIGPVNFYSAGGEKSWNWAAQPWPWERQA